MESELTRELRHKRETLLRRLADLLWEYDDLRRWFRGRTPREAEEAYYDEGLMAVLEYNSEPSAEGLYDLHHVSLSTKIKENRKDRNALAAELAKLKVLFKDSVRTNK